MKQKWFLLAIGLIALLGASAAFAQTTGSLVGIVTDADAGQPLPGVQVTISSPALQGTRTAFTDGSGNFRFREIPPGSYKVVASLSGFGSMAQEGIRVGLDRTVEVRLKMTAAVTEFVTVTGETPLVDVKSTTTGENFSEEVLEALPLGRNFTSALRVVPSAQADGTGYSMNGATGAENSYIVDGVETTEIERGRQGKQINMEFVQEIETKTGGYQAEYGRAAGGIVNVITKSGGNEFKGDLFAYYEDDSLTDDFDGEGADESTATERQAAFTRKDFGFALGGYILPDKLWFFAAYDVVQNETATLVSDQLRDALPELDSSYDLTTDRDLRSAKLTWNISSDHNVVFSLFGDPGESEGAVGVISGEESTFMSSRELGGDNYTLKYLGILTPSLFLNVQGSKHKESSVNNPMDSTTPTRIDRTGDFEVRTGGYGGYAQQEFERDQYKADVNFFLDFAGTHDFKIGIDYEDLAADKRVAYSGGNMLWVFNCTGPDLSGCPEGELFYAHEFYVTKGSTSRNWTLQPYLEDSPETKNSSAFLQDSWSLSNLTVNLGVRYEKQELLSGEGRSWIEVENWAPRVGFTWDPTGSGKSVVSGFYGRFFQNIPMDINIRFMGTESSAFFYNQSETDLNRDFDICNTSGTSCGGVRGSLPLLDLLERVYGIYPIDPDLKGQSVDEFNFGYETQVGANWSFGVQGVYKTLNRVIEDGGAVIINAEGDPEFVYVVGNPGEGTMTQVPTLGTDEDHVPYGPWAISKPKRDYQALQLTARRRLSENWGLFASYVYSKLEGNYDGTYQRSTGQLDPMINSAFDYYEFGVKWDAECYKTGTCEELDGPLSNDRRHQVKVDLYYSGKMGPGNLTASFSPYYFSGRPKTIYGWSDAYRNGEFTLTNRGGNGRTPSEYEIDLGFGYEMPIGPFSVAARLDVFNVLNRQGTTDVDMLWSIDEAGNSSAEPTNPGFDKPNDWQDPRNYRFSLRFSF